MKSGDRIPTGTGERRRQLTLTEAKAGGLPEPFTKEEWNAMHEASKGQTTPIPLEHAVWVMPCAETDESDDKQTRIHDPFTHPMDRVNLLQKENEALREQIARMQPVVEAATAYCEGDVESESGVWYAVKNYRNAMPTTENVQPLSNPERLAAEFSQTVTLPKKHVCEDWETEGSLCIQCEKVLRKAQDPKPLTTEDCITWLEKMGASRIAYPFTPLGHPARYALLLPPKEDSL